MQNNQIIAFCNHRLAGIKVVETWQQVTGSWTFYVKNFLQRPARRLLFERVTATGTKYIPIEDFGTNASFERSNIIEPGHAGFF
jgi:hypothetical protein